MSAFGHNLSLPLGLLASIMDNQRGDPPAASTPPIEEPSLDLSGQGALLFGLFVSALLHAVLAWSGLYAGTTGGAPIHRASLHARLTKPPPSPTTVARLRDIPPPAPQPAPTSADMPAALPEPPRETHPPAPVEPLATPSDGQGGDLRPPPVPPLPIELPGPHYMEANQLSDRPRPLTEISLDALLVGLPPQIDLGSNGRLELTLLINSEGRVDDVLVDGGNLPDALADAIKATFRQASFHPGRMDGAAVNARHRILIEVTDAPVPATPQGAPAEPTSSSKK